MPATKLHSMRVPKAQPYTEFKRDLLKQLDVPEGEVRLWVLVNRQNKTVRPDAPVPDDPTLSELVDRLKGYH